MRPATPFDCIVVGAGHNGLTCAAYLARGGRRVLVLEAAETVGGAAVTREFHAGFRVSAGAHLLPMMSARILRELRLDQQGLEWAGRELPTTAVSAGAAPLSLGGWSGGAAAARTVLEGESFLRLRRFAQALAPALTEAPPRLAGGPRAAWDLARFGWRIRRLGRRDLREFLRIIGMNVHDLLEEQFDSPQLRGALAMDALLGSNLGPRSPGTVLSWLHRLAAQEHSAHGIAQPRGGVGALCNALAAAAAGAGAVIRTRAAVRQILVEGDRAAGVLLDSGERLEARSVLCSTDPHTTFLGLLGARHLDAEFARRVAQVRSRGLAAKLHLALDRAPQFTALSAAQANGRLLLAPSLDYLEHAYNHVKYGEFSAAPAMEITLPTMNDPALAPRGGHVLSAIVQYAPYALAGGWEDRRQPFIECCLQALEGVAPGLRASILGLELLTPTDLEREFGMRGGHWHHVELAFDQYLMVRPVPGAAQYATPVPGLYLCGAGCHPGGGVMGACGRNAARRVLREDLS